MWRPFLMAGFSAVLFVFMGNASAGDVAGDEYLPIRVGAELPAEVIVEAGDHLWSISATHLERSPKSKPTAPEITPLWLEIIAMNVDHLISGDPDLIYPGEVVLIPEPISD